MWVGSASPTAGRDAPRMSPGSGRRLGVGCWRGFHRGPRSRPGVARADLELITAPRAALQDRSADGSRAPVAHKYRVMVDVRDLPGIQCRKPDLPSLYPLRRPEPGLVIQEASRRSRRSSARADAPRVFRRRLTGVNVDGVLGHGNHRCRGSHSGGTPARS